MTCWGLFGLSRMVLAYKPDIGLADAWGFLLIMLGMIEMKDIPVRFH